MTPDELLVLARELAGRETGRPKQTSLKRAVSTAYYALFHAIAAECVGRVLGAGFRSPRYWEIVTPVYRAIDHSGAKRTFGQITASAGVEPELKQVGWAFIELQEARIQADYDPEPLFTRGQVFDLLARAEDAVEKLRRLSVDAKRELVAHLLGKRR